MYSLKDIREYKTNVKRLLDFLEWLELVAIQRCKYYGCDEGALEEFCEHPKVTAEKFTTEKCITCPYREEVRE